MQHLKRTLAFLLTSLSLACGGNNVESVTSDARLTSFDLQYDTSKPMYVNNRVPVTFGLTGLPAGTGTATRAVTLLASFVEADPPAGVEARGCSSSSIDVELDQDGAEHLFTAHLWPTSLCAAFAGPGKRANIEVQIGEEGAAQIVGSVELRATPSDGAGTPLVNVHLADLELDSSVAVLPAAQVEDAIPGAPEDLEPLIVVSSSLVINGRDPYYSALDPALVPAGLEGIDAELGASRSDLPGRGTVSYAISAASDGVNFRSLTIAAPSEADPSARGTEVALVELLPGVPNGFSHELFAEGATRAALDDGDWADVDDFILRGCFAADFTQAGNEGDTQVGACRDVSIVLVRGRGISGAASSKNFDKKERKKAGSSRIAIETDLTVENLLDRRGLFSKTEGVIALRGKLGKSFDRQLARAFGTASLHLDEGKNDYEVGVFAFEKRIYTFRKEGDSLENDEKFSANKDTRLGGLGFGFGPVRVGFSISAGGRLGFEPVDEMELLSDPEACGELLGASQVVACGRIARGTTPRFAITGRISGGIDIRIVKAEVVAELSFIDTTFPLTVGLAAGITEDGRVLILGDARWDLELTLIKGKVSIVGRVGFRRFSKSLKVNLFEFSSPTITRNLLNRSMSNFEELE